MLLNNFLLHLISISLRISQLQARPLCALRSYFVNSFEWLRSAKLQAATFIRYSYIGAVANECL